MLTSASTLVSPSKSNSFCIFPKLTYTPPHIWHITQYFCWVYLVFCSLHWSMLTPRYAHDTGGCLASKNKIEPKNTFSSLPPLSIVFWSQESAAEVLYFACYWYKLKTYNWFFWGGRKGRARGKKTREIMWPMVLITSQTFSSQHFFLISKTNK